MKYSAEICVAWFAAHGLIAEPEYKFHEKRKWRFDFAFLESKVALECQGGLFTNGRHSRGAALLKEHEKLNEAAAAGWRIIYTTPSQITMMETIEILKRAVGK